MDLLGSKRPKSVDVPSLDEDRWEHRSTSDGHTVSLGRLYYGTDLLQSYTDPNSYLENFTFHFVLYIYCMIGNPILKRFSFHKTEIKFPDDPLMCTKIFPLNVFHIWVVFRTFSCLETVFFSLCKLCLESLKGTFPSTSVGGLRPYSSFSICGVTLI